MDDFNRIPTWALELVAGLEEHEDVHPRAGLPDQGDDPHVCAKAVLDKVPAAVRNYVAGWAAGMRRAEQEQNCAPQPTPDLPVDAAFEGGEGR